MPLINDLCIAQAALGLSILADAGLTMQGEIEAYGIACQVSDSIARACKLGLAAALSDLRMGASGGGCRDWHSLQRSRNLLVACHCIIAR